MNVDNPFTLDIPSHGFDLLIPSNYFGYPCSLMYFGIIQDNLWAWWVHQVEARDSEVCFFLLFLCVQRYCMKFIGSIQ